MDRIQAPPGARAPALARLAAVAAALALAAPAGAATTTTRPPAKRTAPAATPPSLAPAVTPAAAPLRPPAPPRTAPVSPAALATTPRVAFAGGGVGALSAFGTGKGLLVLLDYGILRPQPAGWRRVDVEWHLVASFASPSGDKGLTAQVAPTFGTTPIQVNAGTEKVSALLFEVIPTARALFTPVQGVAFFGDAGLGLAQSFESYDRTEMYQGHSTHREYATGLVLHLGAGMALDVAPRWRVLFAPLAFDLMVGPKFSAWTPSLGVAFRL